MSQPVEDELKKIPIINRLVALGKRIILPGMEGLSAYDLWEMYSLGIIKGTFSTRASAIAFSFFMALFPFLLFILNLIPFITFINDFQLEFLTFVDALLPPTTSEFFNEIFADIASNQRGGLLSVTFILSIFLMANGVNAVFTGFEYSFHTSINRSILRQYLVAVGVSIVLALLLLITVIVTVYTTYIIDGLTKMGVFSDDVFWLQLLRYAVFVLIVYIITALLYYTGTRESRRTKFFSIGALFTTLLIMITTYLFGIYIENFSNYNELYGSIGTLLILMVYIWINSNIILLGFELNASIYKLKQNFA